MMLFSSIAARLVVILLLLLQIRIIQPWLRPFRVFPFLGTAKSDVVRGRLWRHFGACAVAIAITVGLVAHERAALLRLLVLRIRLL